MALDLEEVITSVAAQLQQLLAGLGSPTTGGVQPAGSVSAVSALPSGWGALVFYAAILAGSVSIGYLLVRLAVPEIRTRPMDEKIGASAVAGAVVVLAAMAIDFLVFGWAAVSAVHGFLPIILAFAVGVSFTVAKCCAVLFPRRTVVGVSISALPERKEEESMPEPLFEKL